MCGVFGFTGADQDVEMTVGNALRSLEYRGYDSWGVTWATCGTISTRKKAGRLAAETLPHERASAAIGHTRWATHGGVSDANAHPHTGCGGRLSVVHNGIIENAPALRATLSARHTLHSTTDSEVVPHMLEDELDNGADIAAAIQTVFTKLAGHNAIVVLDSTTSEIFAISCGSPLLVAEGDLGSYIGSDVIAFNHLATRMTPISNHTLTRLGAIGVETQNRTTMAWARPPMVPVIHRENETLGSFEHFTQKEIAEQPLVIERILNEGTVTRDLATELSNANLVVLTGCGSSYFAARLGASWISTIGGIPALAIPASEFSEVTPFLNENTLVIALSQSGETADVIDALDCASAFGARIQAIVNVPYSTIARKVTHAYPLHAGIEQSVLATKSFMAQLTLLLLAAGEMGDRAAEIEMLVRRALAVLYAQIGDQALTGQIGGIARRLASTNHAFMIGRGTGFASAQEGALKIKESSYIHAEALAAGELKHGTIALIENGTPCLIFGDDFGSMAKLASTSQELRSRGAYTIGIGVVPGDEFSEVIELPDLEAALPLVQVYLAQQVAYQAALARGVNPDRPRNLAKSVTVR